MIIKLIQTGGMLGRTKTASVECDLSAKEFHELTESLALRGQVSRNQADRVLYFLSEENSGKDFQIDISKIPLEWQALFSELFRRLRVPPAS